MEVAAMEADLDTSMDVDSSWEMEGASVSKTVTWGTVSVELTYREVDVSKSWRPTTAYMKRQRAVCRLQQPNATYMMRKARMYNKGCTCTYTEHACCWCAKFAYTANVLAPSVAST